MAAPKKSVPVAAKGKGKPKHNRDRSPQPVYLKTPKVCDKCGVQITKIADCKTVVGFFNATREDGTTVSRRGKRTHCRAC